MGAIPEQLAQGLPEGSVRLGARVERIVGTAVHLDGGEVLDGRAVVVATEGPEAHRLLGAGVPDPGSRAAACCWFATAGAPLPGSRTGPRRHRGGTGPQLGGHERGGAHLRACRPQPGGCRRAGSRRPRPRTAGPGASSSWRGWFDPGPGTGSTSAPTSSPTDNPVRSPPFWPKRRVQLGGGRFVCGDHRDTASLQGAMFSGERTAAAVIRALAG